MTDKKLEKERKFLIKALPSSWEDIADLFDELVDIKRISQTYLEPEKDGDVSPRVRKTVQGLGKEKETVFHFNRKRFIEKGVNEEEEKEISEDEYRKFLKRPLKDHFELQKTRFVFRFKGQLFELDVFKPPVKVPAILELEMDDLKENVDLPPSLEIEKEITGSKELNNFELSKKKD